MENENVSPFKHRYFFGYCIMLNFVGDKKKLTSSTSTWGPWRSRAARASAGPRTWVGTQDATRNAQQVGNLKWFQMCKTIKSMKIISWLMTQIIWWMGISPSSLISTLETRFWVIGLDPWLVRPIMAAMVIDTPYPITPIPPGAPSSATWCMCFFFHAAWFHIFHVLHMTDGFTSIVSQCLSSPHFWGVLRLQKGYKVAKLMQLSSFFSKLGLRRGSSSCKKCLIAGGAKSAKNLPSSFDRAMPTPSLTPICPQRLGEQTCHCHCPSFPCNLLGDLQLPGVV